MNKKSPANGLESYLKSGHATKVNTAPVLLLVFNRPDLTARVFGAIRKAKPARLFVAADGPRHGREEEVGVCEETRRITEHVDWKCEVARLYRKENMGCKLAVSGAISWFFENVEQGIILEDDCLPVHDFFLYTSELLERYSSLEDIGTITGFNPHPDRSEYHTSYHFSQHPMIWGWATWRRVWQQYDVSISSWDGEADDLGNVVANRYLRAYLAQAFNQVSSGALDTWDFQLVYLCVRKRLLTAVPVVNLVENIGFDERATHTRNYSGRIPFPDVSSLTFPLCHPDDFAVDREFDHKLEKLTWKVPDNLYEAVTSRIIALVRVWGGKVLRALGLKRPRNSGV